MGIGDSDFKELIKIKQQYPHIKTCAILGDCSFHYRNGSRDHFKKILQLDLINTFDINGNPDYIVDLQELLSDNFKNSYDLIIDPGTLYCVFDIVGCLKNIFHMLKKNGVIFHNSNLVGHFGRGFYALSPSFYNEFYKANNFNILKMAYCIHGGSNKWVPMSVENQYLEHADMNKMIWANKGTVKSLIPCDSSILCIVNRTTEHNSNLKKPIPEHYINTKGR